jgi:predicted porin
MKKLILATCVASICSLTSAKAATVYDKDGTSMDIFGDIKVMAMSDSASRVIKSKTTKKTNDASLLNAVSLGLAGRAKISDGLYAIGFTQWLMPTGNNGIDKIKSRHQYVGVDAQNLGTLTFGRGDNAYYAVAGATDIFNELDSRVNDHYAFGDEEPSLFMYSLSTLGWDLRLSAQTAADRINDTDVDLKKGAAFSMATRTESGISVAYGVSYYKFNYDDDNNRTVKYFQGVVNKMHGVESSNLTYANSQRPRFKVDKGISVSYGTFGEGLYAAVNYTITKYNTFTNHLYSVEGVVNYTFDNGIGLSTGYGLKRFKGANVIADLTIGAYYKPHPAFTLFAEATFDTGSKWDRYYTKELKEDLVLDRNKALIGAQYSY